MTLNVTVLTPTIIYQSADFRLTNVETGKPFPDPSPKTVTLTYRKWNGFITYTGVGSWRDRYLSDYLAEWLTGPADLSMADVAGIAANKGTELLQDIERYYSRRRHTFILVGFEEHGPRVYVISNFEDCFGNSRNDIDDNLTVSTRTLGRGKKATVIVTGYKRAVPLIDRRILGSVAAKYPGDSLRIRRRMAKLNADAAPRSNNMVSPECVVLSFRSDGAGAMQLDRDAVEVPQQFPHIMNGVNVNKVLTDAMKSMGLDLSKARMVQVASASYRPGQQATGQRTPCNYAVIEPDPSAGYHVTEITSTDFELIAPRRISDRGQIVGTGRAGLRSDQPQNIPWSYLNGQIVRLNYAGLAAAVNDKGQVVAVLQGPSAPPPSWQRAALYDGNNLIELPLYHGEHESPERSDSEASAINSSSVMAGSVAIQRDKSGPLKISAATFRAGHPIVVFDGLRPEYGCRAFDINEQGHVLLMAGIGPSDARSILWNPSDGSWHYAGDDTTNVFPIAMNDDDAVLGQARNEHNQPVAVICHLDSGWERLGTPDNWIPVDINNNGEVLGRVMIDLLERPWLHHPDGRTMMLPYITDHHTNPAAINNLGQIVGSAATDNDFHVLTWHVDR
jgi:uncharacterized membrane protein